MRWSGFAIKRQIPLVPDFEEQFSCRKSDEGKLAQIDSVSLYLVPRVGNLRDVYEARHGGDPSAPRCSAFVGLTG